MEDRNGQRMLVRSLAGPPGDKDAAGLIDDIRQAYEKLGGLFVAKKPPEFMSDYDVLVQWFGYDEVTAAEQIEKMKRQKLDDLRKQMGQQ